MSSTGARSRSGGGSSAPTDLDGCWLVMALTDVAAVNAAVAETAEARGIWCVRADDAAHSPAWRPATTQVDDITVGSQRERRSRPGGGHPQRGRGEAAERRAVGTASPTGRPPARAVGWFSSAAAPGIPTC